MPIDKCDDESCVTEITNGLIIDPNSHNVDLVDKPLHSDHLILLFTSDGSPYRTSIALETFHKAWQQYQSASAR